MIGFNIEELKKQSEFKPQDIQFMPIEAAIREILDTYKRVAIIMSPTTMSMLCKFTGGQNAVNLMIRLDAQMGEDSNHLLFSTSQLEYYVTDYKAGSETGSGALVVVKTPDGNGIVDMNRYVDNSEPLDAVVGIGGGTAIDFAKCFAASYWAKHMIAIPAMLSTDCFATKYTAVCLPEGKHTETTVLPDKVYVPTDLYFATDALDIQFASVLGLVDVFSVFTAVSDWDLAIMNGTAARDDVTRDRALQLLSRALKLADSGFVCCCEQGNPDNTWSKFKNTETLYDLCKLIAEAGYITNDYGSGRPESGAEHIFASALETKLASKGVKVPHGEAVALGICVMEFFWRKNQSWIVQDLHSSMTHSHVFNSIMYAIQDLGIMNAINNAKLLSEKELSDLVMDLVPRKDKWTIIDALYNDHNKQLSISRVYSELPEYLMSLGFKFAN